MSLGVEGKEPEEQGRDGGENGGRGQGRWRKARSLSMGKERLLLEEGDSFQSAPPLPHHCVCSDFSSAQATPKL